MQEKQKKSGKTKKNKNIYFKIKLIIIIIIRKTQRKVGMDKEGRRELQPFYKQSSTC